MRWLCHECDGRGDGDRDGESAGKEAAGGDRGSRHSQDSMNAEGDLLISRVRWESVCGANEKSRDTLLRPRLRFRLSAYGLELTVEWGTGIGP
jgi:hypothetical protein